MATITIDEHELRRRKLERWTALESHRSRIFDHWQDLSRHLQPRVGTYFLQDRDRSGREKYNRIYDNTATLAANRSASAMMAGTSNPAGIWFRLAHPDPDLNKQHSVREWLDDSRDRMLLVFNRSNAYDVLHGMWGELLVFGTSVAMIAKDFANVIHLYPSPPGEYCVGQDNRMAIDTLYRRYEWTVGMVVDEFGRHAVSETVGRLYDDHKLDGPVEILHTIEPRREYDPAMDDSLNMPWECCYIEVGSGSDRDLGILRRGGFRTFPVLAPRWEVNGTDVYGHSPGMTVLGDVRGLQHKHQRKASVIDHQTRPAIAMPTSLKDQDREIYPGGITFYDPATPQATIKPLWEVNLDQQGLLLDIQEDQRRISMGLLADLFLLLTTSQLSGRDPQKTAREVVELHEEKLTVLGPVLQRHEREALKPLVDNTFDKMLRGGMFKPLPPELAQGGELTVEFLGVLAQAQKLIGMNGIDRWMSSMAALSQVKPEALDKVDVDAYADETGERLGVPTAIIVSTQKANRLREARNRAMAAKEQVEAAQGQAAAAKDLAAADTGGQNALTEAMAQMGL